MEGLWRLTREAPPSHFRLKIESFSTLSSSALESYESCEFAARSYTWKLVLYPNGNRHKGVANHISLYLALGEDTCVDTVNKNMLVTFNLFAFDQVRDNYLYVQRILPIQAMKDESGFDKFLSLKIFENPSNGYLVHDTCVFGAEIFVIENSPKGQCLSMMTKKPSPYKYTWRIENFSKLEDRVYYSEMFTTRDHDWKIKIYPKGNAEENGKCVSLYLFLADSQALLPAGRDVGVEFKLRIVDQINGNHHEGQFTTFLNSTKQDWGLTTFLDLNQLNESSGYLVNDTCIVETEVIVLGSAKKWEC